MKMKILVTCPKCGKLQEENRYIRDSETNGGTVDTDCCYCGAVIDDAQFKVLGPVDYK